MFSRHRRFYEIRGKYFVCSDRWIWDRCGWDSTSPTNPIDLFVKYEDFLKSSKYTASLPWIRYSAFTDATLLRYYFWSHHIFSSERWLSWKHCIVVFVAFFMWNALSLWILYVTAWLAHFENSKWISAPVQTMMTLCHPLVSISFWMSFNISPREGADILLITILNALYS